MPGNVAFWEVTSAGVRSAVTTTVCNSDCDEGGPDPEEYRLTEDAEDEERGSDRKECSLA